MNTEKQQSALDSGEFRANRGDSWGELARFRLAFFYEHVQSLVCEDDKAADFGGNDGWVAEFWQTLAHFPMLVIDGLTETLASAQKHGLATLNAEIENLPLPDASIDWGFCSHTLEHCDDLDRAIAELYRVTKRAIMIVVPLEDDELVKKNTAHNHHNADPVWWTAKINHVGFVTKTWRDGRNPYDVCILAIKPDFVEEFNCALQAQDEDCPEAADERVGAFLYRTPSIAGTWADIGGGNAQAAQRLLKVGASSVSVFDINERNRARVEAVGALFRVGAIGHLPVNATYDWIYCSHTLEHSPVLGDALREIYALARKGAWLVVPLHDAYAAAHFRGHWSYSTDPNWWLDQIRSIGFTVTWHSAREQLVKPGLFQLFVEVTKEAM